MAALQKRGQLLGFQARYGRHRIVLENRDVPASELRLRPVRAVAPGSAVEAQVAGVAVTQRFDQVVAPVPRFTLGRLRREWGRLVVEALPYGNGWSQIEWEDQRGLSCGVGHRG